MALIRRSPYFEVTQVGIDLVRLIRLPTPWPTLDEVARETEALLVALAAAKARALLIDLRGGPPGRVDPEFEQAIEPLRRGSVAAFSRVAILVKSAVGQLQIRRVSKQDGLAPLVFRDEAEALSYLRHPTSRP